MILNRRFALIGSLLCLAGSAAAEPAKSRISVQIANRTVDRIIEAFRKDVAQYGGRLVKVMDLDNPAYQATTAIQ